MEKLNKKYGLFTAVCMVVGIVIGSGIFFKAQRVIDLAGNGLNSVLAWLISGAIMVVIATTFAVMATKYEKVNGVVDYAEVTCGKAYAYGIGWFMSLVYYPAMTSVLAWVSARYTLYAVVGSDAMIFSPECITLSLLYLVLAYFINTISPKIAGKFQVSATVVKFIPILFIAIVGTIIGLVNGNIGDNFSATNAFVEASGGEGSLFAAICGTIFAYEGWVIATAINSEIKDSKKNLPIALCFGTLVIVVAYTLFNLGILGLADIGAVAKDGTGVAFAVFGKAGSTIIHILIVISCLGTLNGLMLGCTRGMYSIAARGEGIAPETLSQVDKKTNMPHNSASFALLACAVWFVYFIAANAFGWFGNYGFDSSELPIVTIYPMYVPIFVAFMIKEKDLHWFKRFVLPCISIVGVGIIVAASVIAHGMGNVWYLIVFAVIMAAGYGVYFYNKKSQKKETAPSEQ